MNQKHVVIIGGGISGLAAAHRLKELDSSKNLRITVLESGNKFGGVIETFSRDGFLLEGGPDAFLSEKPWAADLCRRLGIEAEILPTNQERRRSFIYKEGALEAVPEGFYLIAPTRWRALWSTPLLSWRGKFRMACDFFIPPRRDSDDESVADFIRRRFGREAFAHIGQPMIGGIYTADPEFLSMNATLPQFVEMERRYGSVIKGLFARRKKSSEEERASGPRYSLFLSLKSGIEQMVQALLKKMPEVVLRCNSPVSRIERGKNWKIILENAETLDANLVCLALPAYRAASFIKSFAQDLAGHLEKIPYESVATINLAYRRQDIRHTLNGFGFIVPAREKRKILACTFVNVKYPGRAPEDKILLRAFAGGALQREIFKLDDAAMEKMVQDELREILGISVAPLFTVIRRFPRSMPQYHIGHLENVAAIEKETEKFPGLFLTGNAYRGVGIPDCIHHAEQIAEKIFMSFPRKRESILGSNGSPGQAGG